MGASAESHAAADVPSRRALSEAEEYYLRTGDELEGFLSEESGFLSRVPAELALPESHRAWDEIAAALPSLWRDIGVRAAVRELPPLRGTEDALPARYVRRASTILAVVAHSYVHSEREPFGELPAVHLQPWDDLGRRMGKPEPFMRYEDAALGNWFRPEPSAPLTIEGLRLLVPATGLETERRFYLTQVEIHARATPIVGAVVRAQEMLARGDEAGVEAELLTMIETVRALTDEVLLKLDPNPRSPTVVDPILFGGIVADLAVPYQEHIPGPSGTAAPLFHVLDAFLGRKAFDSAIGVDAVRLRQWGPPAVARFVTAVAEGPGAQAILADGPRRLRGLVQTLVDAYSGPWGWLERHRLKVYGFIEMSFKAGRPVTIGGFGGTFHDRPWQAVHTALREARAERDLGMIAHAQQGVLRERTEAQGTTRVVLDVGDEGIVYRPGDRCQVIPSNGAEAVGRTLAALKAEGDEPIALTSPWRLALRQRSDEDDREEIPLAEFLTYARLRPLFRGPAKALLGAFRSPALAAIVDARREDELELWEALELIAQDGYDVSALLPSLASVVPPEVFRHYAIVSGSSDAAPATTIELAVGAVEYTSSQIGPEPGARCGAASSYLTAEAPLGSAVPVSVFRPTRFHSPNDDGLPIAVFADAQGLDATRSILDARVAATEAAAAWAFVEADGSSAADRSDGRLTVVQTKPGQRISGLIASGSQAARVRELIATAQLYVCGSGTFVHAVTEALGELESAELVRRLVAERRVMFQILPVHVPWSGPGVLGDGLFDISELVLHNEAEQGYWLAIAGNVYDMTEFRHLHPGGAYIIDASAGMDASQEYATVLHYLDPEINAMLEMYKIGAIRQLSFHGDAELGKLFRDWARALFLAVEMQNAFENDLVFQRSATTGVEAPDEPTGLKLVMFSKAHDRFIELYLRGLAGTGSALAELWRRTAALSGAAADGEWLERELIEAGEAGLRELLHVPADLRDLCEQARGGREDEQFWSDARATVAEIAASDRRFLAAVKDIARDGLVVFERHEQATREHTDELLDQLRRLPEVVAGYRLELAGPLR